MPTTSRVWAKGCEIAQRVFETDAFAPYLTEQQLPPAPPGNLEEWAAYARPTAGLAYHPSGTCRMVLTTARWWTRRCACAVSMASGWSTPRSCRVL